MVPRLCQFTEIFIVPQVCQFTEILHDQTKRVKSL